MSLNFLRLSSRMDAIVQRLQTADSIKLMSRNMVGTTKIMETAMKNMNLAKISQTMDTFEKQVEELDIQSNVMNEGMKSSTAMTTPSLSRDSDDDGFCGETRDGADACSRSAAAMRDAIRRGAPIRGVSTSASASSSSSSLSDGISQTSRADCVSPATATSAPVPSSPADCLVANLQ